MNLVKSAVLSLALLSPLSACGGGVVGAIEDWADASCSCKDKACAEKQKVEFDKIESKYRKDIKEWSKSDEAKAEKAYEKGNSCLEKYDVHAG